MAVVQSLSLDLTLSSVNIREDILRVHILRHWASRFHFLHSLLPISTLFILLLNPAKEFDITLIIPANHSPDADL